MNVNFSSSVHVRNGAIGVIILSMVGRLVLLKHVLQDLPTYSLVIMEYTNQGYQKLEAIYREFLWGYSTKGKAKRPLVTWEKISCP